MAQEHPTVMYEQLHRPKLGFSGPQALWFLDQLVSNQVENSTPGQGLEALLLTPKGRITSVFRILATAQGALVDADGGDRQGLYDFFANRVFATRVQVRDVTDDFLILRLLGPNALSTVAAGLELGEAMPEGAHSNVSVGSAILVALAPPFEGVDLWVRTERMPDILALLERCRIRTIDHSEYEVMRVEAGVPAFDPDLSGSLLPQEAALERAVHYSKGCYLGQEAVAMAQRGRVRKRLRHLNFTSETALGEVSFDGEAAGTVTSVSRRGYGIGMIKTAVPPDSQVTVGDTRAPATVKELPGTVYGPSVPSARELRERLRNPE